MEQDRYRELEVWQLAYRLALQVYRVTARFPREERYGLAQQLRRSAVSVFSNIAEGHARGSRREYLQSCTIARGSQTEVRSLLMLSNDLGFLEAEEGSRLNEEYGRVGQMLNRLVAALRPPK
ncbi:MAG: four helix bundle protein [bacterium]